MSAPEFGDGLPSETARAERAVQWIDDVRLALERLSGESGVDPEDERFVLQIEKGMQLSEARVELFAILQDRREAFFTESGADPILEQFSVLKLSEVNH